MAAVSHEARRGKPHPPVGVLLAQLPNILGDDERRAAAAVGALLARASRGRAARVPAPAGAAAGRMARPN
jgi:hypothetical protein